MKSKTKAFQGGVFLGLFLISLLMQMLINNGEVFFDASLYWELGKECGWSVRNMTSAYRGWLLPFFFSICYKLGMLFGKEFLGYWILSSIVFAITFTILFFAVSRILEFEKDDIFVVLAGGGCGIVFWLFFRGLFTYPLSDFFAFFLSLTSLILMHAILEKQTGWYIKAIQAFLLGLCLYGAYNIRTIYLFLAIVCIGLMVIWQIYEKKWIQTLITVLCCWGGMAVCALPQMILNHKLFGVYVWKVPTGDLMLFQLHCGISTGRYATYVGDMALYAARGMYFEDGSGQAILDGVQLTEFNSYGEFFSLILRHPLDFAGIYMRHLLNILYPFYPNQYIKDITRDKSLLLLVFYTILFIAVFSFVHSAKLKSKKWIWLFLILVPCFCILPGAVEIRFFIALHFIIYMYATLGIKEFITQFRMNKMKYMAGYLVGFLLYIAYAGMLLATAEFGVALINP